MNLANIQSPTKSKKAVCIREEVELAILADVAQITCISFG